MPVVSLTLEDSNRSVLSPAYFKIIQDIVDTIKIPYGTLVVVHKDIETTLTDNKTNVSLLEKNNLPTTVSKRRIQASITEEYNEDELTTTAVHQPSAYPIFHDPDISVMVYPIYVKSDISIEFTYISPSKIEANRIRDDIRLRLSQTRNIHIHEIEYSILIPEIVEEFVADVYDLKSRLNPTTLEQYFKENSTNRIYPITDMSNKDNTKLAVHEKQIRIIGLFDFSSMPEKLEIDNENNNYKFTFAYKFSMDVPRAMALRYPVMICNRLLPAKYISFIEENKINSKEEHKKIHNYTSNGLANLSHFEAHRQLENRLDIKLPINIPMFDDFALRKGHKGYAILYSFLVQVDETDGKTLLNLKDIEPYRLSTLIENFIKEVEYPYISTPYASFLYLGLHQEGTHYDNSVLKVETDLTVKSKVNINLNRPVRVTLSICLDLSMLNENAILRMKRYPGIWLLYLNEMLTHLNNFKTEAQLDFIDNTLYYHLLLTMHEYLESGDTASLHILADILLIDNLVSNTFARLLYLGNPELYKRLLKNNILRVNTSNFSIVKLENKPDMNRAVKKEHIEEYIPRPIEASNQYSTERHLMKTVMQNYVVAYREEDR